MSVSPPIQSHSLLILFLPMGQHLGLVTIHLRHVEQNYTISQDISTLKSGKFYQVPFLELRLKPNLYQIPPGMKQFWNLDQIPLAVSYIWNILHSPHHSTHTCQHPDQTLSRNLPLFWFLSMDALLPKLPNICTLISHNACPVSATGWWLHTGTKAFMPHSSVARHVLCQGLGELTPGQWLLKAEQV